MISQFASYHLNQPSLSFTSDAYSLSKCHSTLTYQVGQDDESVHVRITKNTGGGFFSDEWVSLIDIRSVLDE
jgi:hypothetical protein